MDISNFVYALYLTWSGTKSYFLRYFTLHGKWDWCWYRDQMENIGPCRYVYIGLRQGQGQNPWFPIGQSSSLYHPRSSFVYPRGMQQKAPHTSWWHKVLHEQFQFQSSIFVCLCVVVVVLVEVGGYIMWPRIRSPSWDVLVLGWFFIFWVGYFVWRQIHYNW